MYSNLQEAYDAEKLNLTNAYIMHFFCLHYFHTKQYRLRGLYIFTLVIKVWVIWHVALWFFIKHNIEEYNEKLYEELEQQYSS